MSKLQLVLSDKDYTSFNQPWIIDIAKDYFNIVYIEHNPSIDKNAIFVTNALNNKQWFSLDHKLIIDNLWEVPKIDHRGLVLTNKNWFWYNESLWYRSLGYNNYIPKPNFAYKAFMPINIPRPWRQNIIDKLDTRLDTFLWSYNSSLVGDIDRNHLLWQRYFNPDWYDLCEFSFVVESNLQAVEFVTEKTFKPIAFNHPFIVYGSCGTLEFLKRNGFETFDNMFDETYDYETNSLSRLDKLIKNVDLYNGRDNKVQERLDHNRNHFFNKDLVTKKIYNEIIVTILEYAEHL